MAQVHAWRGMGSGLNFGGGDDGANDGFELGARNRSGAKQDRNRTDQRKDGGFDADLTGTPIEHAIYFSSYFATEGVPDVLGDSGGKFGEAVSAGCGERDGCCLDQGLRDGMRGHAQADGRESGSDDIGNRRLFFYNQGQRTWPEFLREAVRDFRPHRCQRPRHFYRCDVDDEWAGGGSALDGEDAGDGIRIESIGPETVDGFGGEGHEAPSAEQLGGAVDFAGSGAIGHNRL